VRARGSLSLAVLWWALSCGAVTWSATGCASAATVHVAEGAAWVPAANGVMRSEGVMFAPYEAPPYLGAEGSQAHLQCIYAVNRAVYDVLRTRFSVVPPATGGRRYADMPQWARGPGGPRAVVHIPSFQCGPVTGELDYTLSPTAHIPRDEPWKSVVVIELRDRRSGQVVVRVIGEAEGDNGAVAAKRAAESATRALLVD
jgi:hypothetical protein